jgi:hypothetical protein
MAGWAHRDFLLNFQKMERKSGTGAVFLCPLAEVDLSFSKNLERGHFNDEK